MKKIVTPSSQIIEIVAGKLAAVWYEIGRSQGLTSVHKNARSYARANIEKFIPKAIDHLLDMLNRPDIPQDQKDLIYDAISERVNDPANITSTEMAAMSAMPDIDIKKLLDMTKPDPVSQALTPKCEKPLVIRNT